MFDASAKLPSGIEHGAVYQFGNFDECMAATAAEPFAAQQPDVVISSRRGGDDSTAVQPQYCLAEVQAVGYTVRVAANRHYQVSRRRDCVAIHTFL